MKVLVTGLFEPAALHAIRRFGQLGYEVYAAEGHYLAYAAYSKYVTKRVRLPNMRHKPKQYARRLLQEIETALGRKREVTWGARTIDLDILLYGREIVSTDRLIVPHPLMHERRFVMQGLGEIAPDVVHPILCMTAQTILESLGDLE